MSPREVEVLRLLATGRTNGEIAGELVLSVRTVERHILHIYEKIGARGRADAIAFALKHGLDLTPCRPGDAYGSATATPPECVRTRMAAKSARTYA